MTEVDIESWLENMDLNVDRFHKIVAHHGGNLVKPDLIRLEQGLSPESKTIEMKLELLKEEIDRLNIDNLPSSLRETARNLVETSRSTNWGDVDDVSNLLNHFNRFIDVE